MIARWFLLVISMNARDLDMPYEQIEVQGRKGFTKVALTNWALWTVYSPEFVATLQLELGSDCSRFSVEVLSMVAQLSTIMYRHLCTDGSWGGKLHEVKFSPICRRPVDAPCTFSFNPQDHAQLLKEFGYEGCCIWLGRICLRVASQPCNELVVRMWAD